MVFIATVGDTTSGTGVLGYSQARAGVEAFASLLEAQVVIEDWRIEYNTTRPHSSWAGWRRPPTPKAADEADRPPGLS